MASASEEVQGPVHCPPFTPNGFFITLHLYLPSGEFVCEHDVFMGMGVDAFTIHLEEGLVTPELNLQRFGGMAWSGRHGGIELEHRDYLYILVWNGMVLESDRTFDDYILAHGMSLDEPNDVIVVTKECVFRAP